MMRDLIISIFGEYEPVLTTVLNEAIDGTVVERQVVASGMAGVDWPYVLGVLLFAIVLYSFLRMVGLLLAGGGR